jgi:MmyB-like transcription regulator ligand binding domain
VWNTPYRRVRHDLDVLPGDRRNLLWMMFTDAANRARMPRWEPAARRAQPVQARDGPDQSSRAGQIAFEMFQLRLVEHPDALLVMQVPVSSDDLQRVTSLLGSR